MSVGEIADLFHSDLGWSSAIENLRGLEREHGEEARARALSYATVLMVATAAAEDIGMSRLVLDQMLWWMDND